MKNPATYQDAGVNIDTGNAFVKAIAPFVKKTKRPEVLTQDNGFAALFSINKLKYDEPVLVSSTDGVGTKLKIAKELKSYKGIGVDLVAMCVNDLLCVGAEPLFFLDYYACGRLKIPQAVDIIEGIANALAEIHCALIGGETAEMPGVYQDEEFDLAGFAVGVVNRSEIIEGTGISIGNKVIGLASSGVHSNGFSLVRKIIHDNGLDLRKHYPTLSQSLGNTLLEPTIVYVNQVLQLKKYFPLLGIAHITGGGLLENIPRILPKSSQATLHSDTWPMPPIFKFLQEKGSVAKEEMHRVFNCGIGMVLIVQDKHAKDIVDRLNASGLAAYVIGEITPRVDSEAQVKIV